MTYRGCIIASENKRVFLEKLGVKVGDYNHQHHEFENCEVDIDAIMKLDKYWGLFYWHLEPIKELSAGKEG